MDGDSLALTLPFSVFDGHGIKDVIDEHFSNLVPDKDLRILYELKANWEDPAHSPIAGENQVLPEALEGPSVLVRYGWDKSMLFTPLTRGQRANLIVDFKARVDALDVPYAFGTACDDDNSIIIKTGLDHMGGPILQTIGKNGYYFNLTTLPSEGASYAPWSFSLVKAEPIRQDTSLRRLNLGAKDTGNCRSAFR